MNDIFRVIKMMMMTMMITTRQDEESCSVGWDVSCWELLVIIIMLSFFILLCQTQLWAWPWGSYLCYVGCGLLAKHRHWNLGLKPMTFLLWGTWHHTYDGHLYYMCNHTRHHTHTHTLAQVITHKPTCFPTIHLLRVFKILKPVLF